MATTIATIDTQHADMVHDAQFDYYGRRLATCSSDRLIKVYDVSGDEHALSAELSGHEGPVWQVCWAHPQFGTLLASCGYDRRVIIQREVAPGQWTRIHTFEDHASSVNSIAWAPHEYGLQLAAASSDGKVTVLTHRDDDSWAVSTFDDCPMGVNAVSWAPASHVGGKAPAADGSGGVVAVKRLATAGCDHLVRVYASGTLSAAQHAQAAQARGPLASGEGWALEASLAGHKDWVRDVAFAPASGLVPNMLASCSDDGTVIIWRQAAGGGDWSSEALPHFPAPVWRVSWSVTGNLLAVSCGDNSVTLWRESLSGPFQHISTVPDPTLPPAPRPAGY